MRPAELLVREARPEDAGPLAANMRVWDLIECVAFRVEPYVYLRAAISDRRYRPWVMEAPDGAPIAIGCTVPSERPGVGCPWMLGTDGIRQHARGFWRTSQRWRDRFLGDWPEVENVIPAERVETIRWLSRLGFDIGPAFLHDAGMTMRLFRMRRARPDEAERPPA